MKIESFLFLFDRKDRESIQREIENGVSFAVIGGVPVLYMGNLPEQSLVMISSFGTSTLAGAKELYVSTLEAAIDRVEIITYGDNSCPSSILQGIDDGGGRLHFVSAAGIRRILERSIGKVRKILLSGGSIISSSAIGYDRTKAEYLVSFLSSSVLSYVGARHLHVSNPLFRALDEGKDVSILRSSLQSRAGRRLASEGCPVSSSFSSFSEFSGNVVYHSEEGRYSFLDERYDSFRFG